MKRKRDKDLEIQIDEDKHRPERTFLIKLKHSLYSVVMGIVFAQVMLFAFKSVSVVLFIDNLFFITYLIICTVLGWTVGEKFIHTLGKKSEEWMIWDNDWKF